MTDASTAASAWRILLVEDSADDAELTGIALREAGLHCELRRVYTEAALLAALDDFAPHVVLSDLNLPGFDGERALALVRSHAGADERLYGFLAAQTAQTAQGVAA